MCTRYTITRTVRTVSGAVFAHFETRITRTSNSFAVDRRKRRLSAPSGVWYESEAIFLDCLFVSAFSLTQSNFQTGPGCCATVAQTIACWLIYQL